MIEVDESPVKVKMGRKEFVPVALLDGRNRLDAIEAVLAKEGRVLNFDDLKFSGGEIDIPSWDGADKESFAGCNAVLRFKHGDDDPYDFVLSSNVHRRHLTADQKRELIAKVLKANPEQSNRQVAAQVKADDKTVSKVRKELEAVAEIPQQDRVKGKDGKTFKAHKEATKKPRPTQKLVVQPEAETEGHYRRGIENAIAKANSMVLAADDIEELIKPFLGRLATDTESSLGIVKRLKDCWSKLLDICDEITDRRNIDNEGSP